MKDEFAFKIAGVPVLLSFKELDAAMQHQFRYEVSHIENRIVMIFDKRRCGSISCLGKMPIADAIKKFQ
ncbi:MAG: hypothetical protein PHX61_02240 [Alphaproteobacteria bacterium]|nr:hypothetical protein [Alphaproteobacteria bacterium]